MRNNAVVKITMNRRSSIVRSGLFLLVLGITMFFGCTQIEHQREAGITTAVSWDDLPGWRQDSVSDAWPALLKQCATLKKRQHTWESICSSAEQLKNPNDQQVRTFIQQFFQPHEVIGTGGNPDGLITGYYEPILNGSLQPNERFAYPLYSRPDSLLVVDLGDLFPSLKGKPVRGRLIGNRVVPFYDRSVIDGGERPLKGNELLWIDDPHGSFFLQVQGSGRVRLPDGSMVGVGYADQNGHSYISIGKILIERGELSSDEVNLFSIRHWLQQHPEQTTELFDQNPSYVFFVLNDGDDKGARGSLNVPLTAERSAAVDRSVIPLGTPIWLSSTLPAENRAKPHPYQRLLFAQDTGGAIKGPVRADVFFGSGDRAERLAGNMKQPGRLYALLPK